MAIKKVRDALRFLLVQVRRDRTMKLHEITCFETVGSIADGRVLSHDLLEKPVTAEELDNVDAVIIGGSGDYSVLDPVPNLGSLVELVHEARFRGVPILGVSWGAQLLASAFGGMVTHNPERREVATISVRLEPAAKADRLFRDMPAEFLAQTAHKDSVFKLPQDAIRLAGSERCPIQAFTFPATGIYGFQFHPELAKDDVVMRLRYYKDNYVTADETVDQIAAELKDTPESCSLVSKWIDRVVLGE